MLTLTDIFAGAGGSSTGAIAVPGVQVALAANHWQLAVDVHNANHPTTEHACVDLHMEDPRNFPRTDVLWASPECTKWSIANGKAKALSREMGGDPTLFDDIPEALESSEDEEINRSRLLMFDVLRFIEHHRYRTVIVENVVDVATQAKYSRAWQLWRRGLDKLGYAHRIVSLNSMHAQLGGLPAPQSRDRLYVVAWPKGEKAPEIERALRPSAWCTRCERMVESRQAWKQDRTVGRYRAQYHYCCTHCGRIVEPGWLPAAAAIDWSIPGQRIGDRARPLSPKTMARIREGLRRYGPHLIERRGEYRVRDLGSPLSTLTANETSKGIILEAAGNTYDAADPNHPRHGQGGYYRVWPDTEPLRTLHGTASKGLLIPVEGRDGKQAQSTSQVLRTQTTRNETGLLVPYYSASKTAKPTSQPVGTLTTVDRYALVTLRGQNAPKPVTHPLDTVTASGNHHGLMSVTDDDVMDCSFRMLEPSEIAAGMAFPDEYQWAGTRRDQVKMAGNAVTPPAARDLVSVVAESLGAA